MENIKNKNPYYSLIKIKDKRIEYVKKLIRAGHKEYRQKFGQLIKERKGLCGKFKEEVKKLNDTQDASLKMNRQIHQSDLDKVRKGKKKERGAGFDIQAQYNEVCGKKRKNGVKGRGFMKNQSSKLLLITFIVSVLSTGVGFAETIFLTETSRTEWEEGGFGKKGKGEFKFRVELDQSANQATITELVRLKNGEVIDVQTDYQIAYVEDPQTSLSHYLSSKRKRGHPIICLVGKPGNLAVEVIMIGHDLFEYTKASSGRFYLASGTVQRLVSVTKDTEKMLGW